MTEVDDEDDEKASSNFCAASNDKRKSIQNQWLEVSERVFSRLARLRIPLPRDSGFGFRCLILFSSLPTHFTIRPFVGSSSHPSVRWFVRSFVHLLGPSMDGLMDRRTGERRINKSRCSNSLQLNRSESLVIKTMRQHDRGKKIQAEEITIAC